MSQLHERFEDLVAGVPAYVVPDARTAWAAGARRRTRHRVGVAAMVAAALAVVASAVTWVPHAVDPDPVDTNGAGVDGYPTRVDMPWHARDLPARPGPLAGLVEGADGAVRAVSATGRVWERFAAPLVITASLSIDGTKLAYVDNQGAFVIRDLNDGTLATARPVTDASVEGMPQGGDTLQGLFWVAPGSPMHWSPDGENLLVPSALPDSERSGSGALIVRADGVTTYVPPPRARTGGAAWPVGWTSPEKVAWVAADPGEQPAWAQLVVTTTAGKVVSSVPLRLPAYVGTINGPASSLSPDGEVLDLVNDGPGARTPLFTAGGAIAGEITVQFPECQISWAGHQPRPSFEGSNVAAVRADQGEPMIMVDPGLRATCATWASDALSGTPHEGVGGRVFGTSQEWLSWHWQEVALTALAGLGAVLLVLLRIRQRRAHHLG